MSRTHFQFHWPATPHAAASARRTVESLPLSVDRDRFEDLRLLLSEAIAGVVQGSEPGTKAHVVLGVSVEEHALRAEVTLGKTASDPAVSAEPPELSGWGMLLVDRLSSGWGVVHGATSGIWFQLPFGFRRDRPSVARPRVAA